MHNPQLSSVLHLAGDASLPPAGPTVVVDQLFDNAAGKAVPASPRR